MQRTCVRPNRERKVTGITLVIIGGCVHEFFAASGDLPQLSALHLDPFGPFFDLFQAEERSFTGSRTDIADFFPGRFALKVGIPEWPCATLNRASAVDRTFAALWVKKGTIAVGVLGERDSAPNDTSMEQPDFANRFVEVLGNFQQFVVSDPNDSGRSCAAIAALCTGKLQSVAIPWPGGFCRLFV